MSDPVFFTPSRNFTAGQIADLTGAQLFRSADADVPISAIASASSARNGDLVFVEGRRNASLLDELKASAVLCTEEFAGKVPEGVAVLVTPTPQRAFAQIGRLMFPDAAAPMAFTGETGVSAHATVDQTATLEPGVIVEAGAVIGAGVAIGAGTVISANAVIGRACRIGRNCFIGPNAVVQYALLGNGVIVHPGAKIGQDGFGYAAGAAGPERIPQIGRVILQDNVEVGANSTIDRGAMADTIIGENTKIDNLVQIAHNVRIGRSCLIAAHCGISGSVTVGDLVMMGGGVGIADHLTIGDGAQLGAGSGFMHNVPPGEMWVGYPGKPIGQLMREITILSKLARGKSRRGTGNG